ncbi:MAG: ATP-binding cassette domain-containing protein [Bacilli bacterium]
MIEVKNLFKRVPVKNGIEVKALDDVSLKIDKVGMVFLLGKSGAGKSTLLNVLGGLDRVDSGEIIINGKSSKDFSQSDFDSYRNTYLGFIFQEYNILNEFSIAENIALAIELQGRKPTNEEIDNILNQVDLAGLAKRKPNELSGGQKQRVAIARALIKILKLLWLMNQQEH